MDRLTSKQLKQLLDFLRGSYVCHDQEAFVTHLVQRIATVIRSDASSYAEFDLRSGRVLEEASRIEPSDIKFPGSRQIFAQHISEYLIATTTSGRATAPPSRSRTSLPALSFAGSGSTTSRFAGWG
jgi:hypothetical protein